MRGPVRRRRAAGRDLGGDVVSALPADRDYANALANARRNFAVVLVSQENGAPITFQQTERLRSPIRLAERTAKGGCFMAAFRMLEAV